MCSAISSKDSATEKSSSQARDTRAKKRTHKDQKPDGNIRLFYLEGHRAPLTTGTQHLLPNARMPWRKQTLLLLESAQELPRLWGTSRVASFRRYRQY